MKQLFFHLFILYLEIISNSISQQQNNYTRCPQDKHKCVGAQPYNDSFDFFFFFK